MPIHSLARMLWRLLFVASSFFAAARSTAGSRPAPASAEEGRRQLTGLVASTEFKPDPGRRRAALAVKRLLDLFLATTGLIVLAPPLLAVAVVIRLVDGPPVLFRQDRAGLHGKVFGVWKFRTMTRDADLLRDELRAHNEISGAAFKMTGDPRITRLGRILRRTSIDELPQLLNVIAGDMSLVGPRPHPLDDVARYASWHFRRLAMRPGITGLWQIEGRRDEDFDSWVEKDLEYIDRWSLGLDLRILIETIPAVLKGEGR